MDISSLNIPQKLIDGKEMLWINPKATNAKDALESCPLKEKDIDEAEARLKRFAPLIEKLFPETAQSRGIIESPIIEIPNFLKSIGSPNGIKRLLLKQDSELAIAGSVKARGGIYEVLHHAEDVALENGILSGFDDDYTKLASSASKKLFASKNIQVGSTGNLGLSIGIMSAALGFETVVHMSNDAWQWKKDLLRSKGVQVIEYEGDYSSAVAAGRENCMKNPDGYFVDDENSPTLFLGYAVAARRLAKQLDDMGIVVDSLHPIIAYLPCGVGGAPGGITFGLKDYFGDGALCVFCEPTQAPCVTLGLSSGLHDEIDVYDIGLSGKTSADGLAVSRPSRFIGRAIEGMVTGSFTIEDDRLELMLHKLWESENIFIEPSACACLCAAARFSELKEEYEVDFDWNDATHIAWATGGRLVPKDIREKLLK